jgi:hypothetical protein
MKARRGNDRAVVTEDMAIASEDEIWWRERFFFLLDGERAGGGASEDWRDLKRQGVKIEETVIVLDSKLRFYFNPLK